MKNLLALVGALVVTFAVAGWYLGWYQIQSTPTPSGHREVDVDLNAQKIRDDLQRSAEKIEKVIQQKNAKTPGTTTTETPQPGSPAPQTFPPA